ncbi:hypothetical protein EVAR_88620_1 [Eumeta japonica]|uniref:Uncharacterized protein n=1 Tax=Eumeta variegata TaxID=151549 RepID=A0A4C1X002_EUMVA|nr:hypothetical protein EVAR_88620_1 [Eumeta japonica]
MWDQIDIGKRDMKSFHIYADVGAGIGKSSRAAHVTALAHAYAERIRHTRRGVCVDVPLQYVDIHIRRWLKAVEYILND